MNHPAPKKEAACYLPMRCRTTVKAWIETKGYGFLNPPPGDDRVIFVHLKAVPNREPQGRNLFAGEPVEVSYIQLNDTLKRLRAVKIEFPIA